MKERKILISPGYGAGWYSWHRHKELIDDKILISLVEKGEHKNEEEEVSKEFKERCEELLKEAGKDPTSIYYGGVYQLVVETVRGRIKICEYDGYESIEYDNNEWI